jgi:hypothetical protein
MVQQGLCSGDARYYFMRLGALGVASADGR